MERRLSARTTVAKLRSMFSWSNRAIDTCDDREMSTEDAIELLDYINAPGRDPQLEDRLPEFIRRQIRPN